MMIHPELLQKTPLNRHHHQEGAKLVEFGGWEMPLQFTKVLEEHKAVRTAVGLFDISHMGVLSVHSGNSQVTMAALNALIPQDLLKIYPGKAVYTQVLNESAGILDDIIVYWMPETQHFQQFPEFMVICNASNTAKVMSWFKQHLPVGVQVDRLNDRYALLALQGPRFGEVLSGCGLSPQSSLPKRFHIGEYTLADQPGVTVQNRLYWGRWCRNPRFRQHG